MLLETLAAGNIKRVGLGQVNGRYFIFHAGVGYDAAVVRQVERRAGLKRYANHALFAFAAVDNLDAPLRPVPAPLHRVPRRRGSGFRAVRHLASTPTPTPTWEPARST